MGSYKAGGPYEMKLTHGTETLSFTNILIGEVWLASGQSNMQFGIQGEKHAKDAIANATDQQIHFFYVPLALSLQPVYEIPAAPGRFAKRKVGSLFARGVGNAIVCLARVFGSWVLFRAADP
jgi:hypothetical protein